MTPKAFCSALLVFAACAAASAQYAKPDLLRMMRSGDGKERALARQLLPREGVAVVADVLPVLADPSQQVWRTASNILSDIANEISAPGFDADRRRFADALLARLAAKPGADEVARLLNIVHLVLPEGADVAPIAAYLADKDLRMNARDALQLAGTTEARAALRAALDGAHELFALALIDALGQLRDAPAHDQLVVRMRDDDPAVRAAAARALAWTGDAALVPGCQDIVAKASLETYVGAADALLLLADAMATNGGRYEQSIALYAWALDHLKGPVLQGVAIDGLGRYGDERAVPLILAAARRADKGILDHSALEALGVLQGHTGSKAIFDNHAALLEVFGPLIYAVYGRRADDLLLPLVQEAAAGQDAYARHVALLALLDSNRPAAIQTAAQQALKLEGDDRAVFVDKLELKAADYRRRHVDASAGAAYVGLYRLASTDEDRKFALEGMMLYPTEDAFALVKDFIGNDQLAQLSVPFLAGIARALYAAKRPDEADRIMDAIVPRIASPADMQAFLASVRGGGPELSRKLGFVTQWHVIGPFPWAVTAGFSEDYIHAPAVDLAASIKAPNGEARTWKAHQTGGVDGLVDLSGLLGMQSNAAAYAYAEMDVAEAGDVVVRSGSDDGIKIWVNGTVVHEHNIDRGLMVDQDQVPAKLVAGKNKILVEITQGGGGWNMCLRITHPDGRPVAFTQ